MSDTSISNPCVLFALGRESQFFRQDHKPHRRFIGAPCWSSFCGSSPSPILVMHIGMGPQAAKVAIDWVLSKPKFENLVYQPKFVVMAGFAGALDESLRMGDVVLAS